VITGRSFARLAFAAGLALFPLPRARRTRTNGNLSRGFPPPLVPADNPMTTVKVELGRSLFYDPRLSVNGKTSCAACHRQGLAFTDSLTAAIGTTGQIHSRDAMSLVNVVYNASLTWGDPHVRRLEEQAPIPIFGGQPIEMGLREADGVPGLIAADARYRDLFARAFPGETPALPMRNAVKAIAACERTIISAASPYGRYHYGGDNDAVSAAARRGENALL
jgi:cytochrome c peroxidase